MANADLLYPIIAQWEGGYQCFKEDKGNYNSKGELVGTNKGVTAQTYEYIFKKCPTIEDMRNLTTNQAKDIFKKLYWDKWQGDKIENQSIANILVDWIWASGVHGIFIPQKMLGLKNDGIVGEKTISALNSNLTEIFFNEIKKERIVFVENIVKRRPEQNKFLKGWKNRIESFKFQ